MDSILKKSAVNFHITEKCNMQCKFCFAKYGCSTELKQDEYFKIIKLLADAGIKKINFAGGEPFLYRQLGYLVNYAKEHGMMTGVITNGSFLTANWIELFGHHLDWLGVSIDSLDKETNILAGRALADGSVQDIDRLTQLIKEAKSKGIRIKINTVVSSYNKSENMSQLIGDIYPDRWKILQALPVKGVNSQNQDYLISKKEFLQYISRHKKIISRLPAFPEDNRLMTSSYLMINPQGKFYQNNSGCYGFSDSILDIGVQDAISQIGFSYQRFVERGGDKVF